MISVRASNATGSARLLRLAGLCAILDAPLACVGPSLVSVEADENGFPVEWYTIARTEPDRSVDVLLVVDDSASMAEEQPAFAASLESFVRVLEQPANALDYRIGITTTNAGNPWCQDTTPEEGALQLRSCRGHLEDFVGEGDGSPLLDASEACTTVCPEPWAEIETLPTTTAKDDEPRPRPWVESHAGATNLPSGLSTVQALQCLAPQGIAGCSFESPLESMWQAVRRAYTDDDLAFGFIRDDAVLLVVLVTDEDDCSHAPAWESMFLPEGNRAFWSDPSAPVPTSAACWNAAAACTDTGDGQECEAVDRDIDGNVVGEDVADALAVLRPVSRYTNLLQEVEDLKQQGFPHREVLVSVVAGSRSDGTVEYEPAAADPAFQQEFGVGPGCESDWGRAAPPVRLPALAEALAFGDARNTFSICDGDHSVAFGSLAAPLIGTIRPACMPICVADMDASTPDVLDPGCDVIQVAPPDATGGGLEEVDVPPCEAGGVLPDGYDVCHVPLVGHERSTDCSDRGLNLEFQLVRREDVVVPPGTEVRAMCRPSESSAVDCPDLP